MAVTDSIVVSFRGPNTTNDGWFEMVSDNRDEIDVRPAAYDKKIIFDPNAPSPGSLIHQRTPRRPGRAPVRFYHSVTANPEIIPLDGIEYPYPLTFDSVMFGTITLNTNGYDNVNQVVFKGRRSEERTEVLQFSLQNEFTVPYAYDNTPIDIRYTSTFLDENLNAVAAPTHAGNGKFVSPVQVYGAMEVRYTTQYGYYWIFYDIPSINEVVEYHKLNNQVGRNVVMPLQQVDIAPLQIISRYGQLITSFSMPRKAVDIYRAGSTVKDEEEEIADMQERSRVVVTERISDPNDPNTFIDVQRFKSVEMYDPNTKRTLKLKFNDPT